MRRLAFINEKGGTGKTTLAVNTAAYFAREKGMRVLVVDMDTQGHAGKSLGVDVRNLPRNVFHALSDPSCNVMDIIQPTAVEGLKVLPGYKELADLPVVIAHDERRAFRLADMLGIPSVTEAFDAVIFDAPPSMGLTTINILVASSEVVVPVGLTYLSLDGCAEVVETVRKVAEEYGRPDLHVTRVVPTLYRKTALADAILGKLREYFPDALTEPLAINVKIDEAQSHAQTIWEYAPRSKGATMLAAIAEQIHRGGSATLEQQQVA